MIFFDTSVISELRCFLGGGGPKDADKEKMLGDIIKNYELDINYFFITPKLFMEVMSEKKVKEKIFKENKLFFSEVKQIIVELLIEENDDRIKKTISLFIDVLELFFYINFKKEFPLSSIYSKTVENLNKIPFIAGLSFLGEKLHDYGKSLGDNEYEYEKFIKNLVEDTVVRYSFWPINFREICLSSKKEADNLNRLIRNSVLRKYCKSEICTCSRGV